MEESKAQNTDQKTGGGWHKGSGGLLLHSGWLILSPRTQGSAPAFMALEVDKPYKSHPGARGITRQAKGMTLKDEVLKNLSNSEVLPLGGASQSPGGRENTDC